MRELEKIDRVKISGIDMKLQKKLLIKSNCKNFVDTCEKKNKLKASILWQKRLRKL